MFCACMPFTVECVDFRSKYIVQYEFAKERRPSLPERAKLVPRLHLRLPNDRSDCLAAPRHSLMSRAELGAAQLGDAFDDDLLALRGTFFKDGQAVGHKRNLHTAAHVLVRGRQ